FTNVEDYWDALVEYEGGILKAREIWNSVKPLYVKLHKYVSLRLSGSNSVGKPLPVHLLKSLVGDDWSNLIENLLPKHAGIYQKVLANLQLKEMGGRKVYKEAEKLLKSLFFGEIEQVFWSDSVFNSTCPTVLVDWCKPNKIRVSTCKDVSIGNYVDAHEAIMKINWSEFRKNFSMIENSDIDFLGDPHIVFNKPYIGKFLGVILKYQIYQSFAEELESDESDLIKHVAENNGRLLEAMMQGYGLFWPEMVSDLLAKRENGLEYTGLTDYYRLLDEYLDNQLDPTAEKEESDDYVEPVIPDPIPEENEIPTSADNSKKPAAVESAETHENIMENEIDVGYDANSKHGMDTSTVGVLEIKNPVAAGDQKKDVNLKEASYNTYWWIGIAVALTVVVVLVALIARKRHSHRKQLERQRRDNTRA
ncbi:Angiotensin-converting enzyme, partial [Operophtera brumata]